MEKEIQMNRIEEDRNLKNPPFLPYRNNLECRDHHSNTEKKIQTKEAAKSIISVEICLFNLLSEPMH